MNYSLLKTLVFATAITKVLFCQEMRVFDVSEAQMIPEINGIAILENGKVIIGPIPPKDQREEQYKKVDLQTGDEILFVNEKKIKSITDFKKFYNEIKIGDEVKFAIQRNNERFIVTFKKAPESSGGKRMIQFSTDGTGGSGNTRIESGKVIDEKKKMKIDSLRKAGKLKFYSNK